MDTISTPISNLQVPKPYNTNHRLHHHKATPFPHHHHPSSTAKTTTTSSISTLLPQKDNFTPLFQPQKWSPSKSTSLTSSLKLAPPPPRSSIHCKAASGYAAALLEISQSKNILLNVEKDVIRLLKVVFNAQVKEFMENEWVDEKAKAQVLKDFMVRGKFEGHLVWFINMLVDKGNSVELVKQVLDEFVAIFHQLTIGFPHHAHAPPATKLATSKPI